MCANREIFEVQNRSTYSNRLVTTARYLECAASYTAEYFTLRSIRTNNLPFKALLKLGILTEFLFKKFPLEF